MKQALNIKISGDKEEIQRLISFLEKSYEVIATSRYIPNSDTGGFHLFADLEARTR